MGGTLWRCCKLRDRARSDGHRGRVRFLVFGHGVLAFWSESCQRPAPYLRVVYSDAIHQRGRRVSDMPRTFAGYFIRTTALLAISCAVACTQGNSGSLSAAQSGNERAKATDTQASSNKPEEFRLGTGDKIRVSVFGADKIGGEFTIDPDGSIYIPLVGAISANGSTLSEVAATVAKRLRDEKMVDSPQVSVGLVEARPFFIYGEVTKSGSYPYLPGLNVLSAIATAGGFTYRATENHVFVRRGGTGNEIDVNLSDPSKPPVPIYPGDIIRVPGRFF